MAFRGSAIAPAAIGEPKKCGQTCGIAGYGAIERPGVVDSGVLPGVGTLASGPGP